MLTPRSLAIALSLAGHASVVAFAAASPHRGMPAQVVADEPLEVSLYSALATEAEDTPPPVEQPATPPVEQPATPPVVHSPLPLADAKPSRAASIGSPVPSESTRPVDVEAAPSAVAPAALHFSLGSIPTRTVLATVSGDGQPAALGIAQAVVAPTSPLPESQVNTRATLRSGAAPSYTAAAEAAGIEAELPFEIVVDRTGAVQSARPLTHVGYGLDEAAALALRSYRFVPAQQAHQPVAVRMRWVVRFQLR